MKIRSIAFASTLAAVAAWPALRRFISRPAKVGAYP
jgi:hypothetical protein